MARIKLYITISLDGFVADRDGGIGWLPEIDAATGADFGLAEFHAGIGALLMGRATYDRARRAGEWPYVGRPTLVLTRRAPDPDAPAGVEFVSGPAEAAAARLRTLAGDRDAWLVGGGATVAAFRAAALIDEYVLTVVPVLLGEGVPLFARVEQDDPMPLHLRAARPLALGAVQLEYTTRAPALAERAPEGVEIERKYLLRALPAGMPAAPVAEVEQGWLPGERLAERLRRTVRDGQERWVRAVKGGTGVARLELEEETTRELFDHLWPLTEGRRVYKRPHYVPAGALTWEIDEFTDRDLVLAEVELPDERTPVPIPEWLAPVLVREVTADPSFLNLNLAR
jgi:dihydrofolate reductase/CYTH domain-containing protein